MVITINIDDGTNNVDVYFTYRWWIPGNDPWSAAVPGYFGNDSGDFAYAGIGGVGSFQVNSGGTWVATLQNIPTNGTSLAMTVGASGTGWHYVTGQMINNGSIQWTCTNIS